MTANQNNTLYACNREWSSRPADERFVTMTGMLDHFLEVRRKSRENLIDMKQLMVAQDDNDPNGLVLRNKGSLPGRANPDFVPTNWSFNQLTRVTKTPSDYVQRLPAPIAAQCLNYGLSQMGNDGRSAKVLWELGKDGGKPSIRSFNADSYGRVYNSDVIQLLVDRFGDGITGNFRVPGEFGRKVNVTKENTTLFASDRNFFVFLADEERRVDIHGRRNDQKGSLARGFFVWNSEVGERSIGMAFFLFDYACSNRIVWGAKEYKEVILRHRGAADERFIKETAPIINKMQNASPRALENNIRNAQAKMIGSNQEEVNDYLAKFFKMGVVNKINAAHVMEEGRPIRSVWDAVTGITAHAKTVPNTDNRLGFEKTAGKILDLVAETV